jgi:2-polyprenyl-3-methyl-5-hydroxy-6-metoxy-1,4-benzoquinol methylase
MLITEEYRVLNRELHRTNEHYGTSGQKWAELVSKLAKNMKALNILDYGCGRGTLGRALPSLPVSNYDPALVGLDGSPEPADLVVCTDVLEHIEPECLDDVLDDLKRCAGRKAFLVVATRPAKKFLADGRNAHLIQMPSSWWLKQLLLRWDLEVFQDFGGEFLAIMRTRPQ